MRDAYCNSYTLSVKDKFCGIRKLITFVIASFVIMSVGYFVFWLGAISDDIFFGYGKGIFEPLASFLNMGSTSLDIYLNTSLMLLAAIIPALFIQYLFDKIEEVLVEQNNIQEEKKRQKELIEEHKSYMGRFDSIKTYSICLSIEYQSDKKISENSKAVLNQVIYSKIASALKKVELNANVTYDDVLIFRAQNFSNYDYVYETMLDELSKIKNVIENKYGYKLIPSTTTDAYSGVLAETNIKKQHFEIQSFNFKNRALSTASFASKYKHLNHRKYAGVPVGEYAYFGDDNRKYGTYELNVVYKNLSKILA